MRLVQNITNGYQTTKRAALYFKTDPLFTNVNLYVHTNNWEILKSIELLNQRGYSVDLIDRCLSDWTPTHKYDLFLGLGVGNSGRNFARYAKASQAKKRVLLSMGPQPDISNERTLQRYKLFNQRTGNNAPAMRTVEQVTGQNFLEILETATHIFNIGEKGTPSHKSFTKYDKPVINFYPSTSPSVSFNNEWLKTRDNNSFLCFAGNGFICKGVDLVVESFLKNPTKKLHICGPSNEPAFWNEYGEKIKNAPNITYHGFIQPGEKVFNSLASKCSYVVFHSASEGCCTSVATAMRAGLVPIINKWTGILVDECIIELSEDGDLVENITTAVNQASQIPPSDYSSLVASVIKKSNLFSQESFSNSYGEALDIVERT